MAHMVLCVVSAAPQENHVSTGITNIYRDLLLTTFSFGAKEIIVAVNKMDIVDYSFDAFSAIQADFNLFGMICFTLY